MKEEKKYWKGLEELNNDPDFLKSRDEEFPYMSQETETDGNSEPSRRDFLKMMGFSVAAVSLAACEAPVRKVIPYVEKPVDVDPGVPNYYATSYVDGSNFCSVVVKTREGRPILIEGNPDSPISKGGVNALTSASVLDLYDSSRLTSFKKGGSDISKADADKQIVGLLSSASSIRIVSQSILSPSFKSVVSKFVDKYPSTKLVQYDSVSAYAFANAYNGAIPKLNFDKASVIVSFSADFLGSWISPIEYSKQYSASRKISKAENKMSRHYQFETTLSVTGSAADYRVPVKPTEEATFVVGLYNILAKKLGSTVYASVDVKNEVLVKAASDLLANRGKSLVVSSSNDVNIQLVVKEINSLLGNVGSTVDTSVSSYFKQGNDVAFSEFVDELNNGKVDAVIFYNANPVYESAFGALLKASLKKAKLSVSFSEKLDETASECTFVCPDTHNLESWGDAMPYAGHYAVVQPTISPIFKDTREAAESLLTWAGISTSYYDVVREYWKSNVFSRQSTDVVFDTFWNKSLQKGFFTTSSTKHEVVSTDSTSVVTPVTVPMSTISKEVFDSIASVYKSKGLELTAYESVKLGNGKSSNNPWLQELPDPISKVTWDNYLAISILDIADSTSTYKPFVGLKDGDIVELVSKSGSVKVPVLVQPGQATGSASIAVGYGRLSAGKLQEGVKYTNAAGEKVIGTSAYPLLVSSKGVVSYSNLEISASNANASHVIARTQTHQTIMGRVHVQETTLKDFQVNPASGRFFPKIASSEGKLNPDQVNAWVFTEKNAKGEVASKATHDYNNHHWGLVIDLSSCTGCSSCVVSCHAENNVPVVGKDEVLRKRDMHWLRIDRYYSSQNELDFGKAEAKNQEGGYKALEIPAYNPEVVFQPMMCQHCNHAPCETVCPVLATTHSSEGLNQMTYNRCIGTRYCANNCPYKVRRFNWFNYSDSKDEGREFMVVNTPANDDLSKMVLNPDVTVRARGVMEKCSMCVQRIQAGKLKAKIEGRKVKDGDIVTACASVCPTDAIVFGDMNDTDSKIYKVLHEENSDRAYHVLEELNVKPNVSYLTKIRNKA